MTRPLLAVLALACIVALNVFVRLPPEAMNMALGIACLIVWSAVFALLVPEFVGRVWTAVLAAGLIASFAVPAFADSAATVAQPATDTAVVTVPLGTWIASYASAAVEIVTAVVMAVITWGLRRLPSSIGTVLKGLITQQLVERGIAFGMNTVAGAAKGKDLSFDVGNAVLANALNYIITHTPGWIVSWTGGVDAIRDHIIALLPVADDTSLATSTPTAVGPTTTAPIVKAS